MAEKRTIELEVQDNSKSLKAQYRDAVKELQNIAAAYGETSDQAIKAAKAAADLKDQIEFSKDLVGAFNPDAKFDALTKSFGGVLDGFQAVEGGLALIGVEGEAVQETMLKVQSAMALSQGIQGLMSAGDSFKQLGAVAKTALSGIRSGIAATGIGLLVVALGTVVAYWDDIKEAVTGVNAEQEKYIASLDKDIESQKHKANMLDNQENTLKLQGKSEKQILQLKIDQTNQQIAAEELRIKAEKQKIKDSVATTKMWQNALAWIIRIGLEAYAVTFRVIALPFDLLIEEINIISEYLGKGRLIQKNLNQYISEGLEAASQWGSKLIFDSSAAEAEGAKTIQAMDENLAQMKNKRDGYLLQQKQGEQQASRDSVNTEKTTNKEKLDLTRELIDKQIALMEDGKAKEIAIAEEKAKREKEDLIKNSKDKIVDKQQLADAEKLIEDNLKKEISGITDKYNKIDYDKAKAANEERIKLEDEQFNALQKLKNSQKEQELLELAQSYDAKFEAAQNNAELEKALTEQFNKEQADIIKKYAKEEQEIKDANFKKEVERRNELRQKTLELTANTFSALADLAGAFNTKNEQDAKRQFLIQKAFNLGAAITNTAMAVTGALTAGGNPIKLATGQQFVEAGIAAAVGAANIIKIANSRFGGGAGGGGNTDVPTPAAGGMTAQFNTIGTSGINQLATLQQQPVQAYVVSGEVTSAQALDRNRVQNATL